MSTFTLVRRSLARTVRRHRLIAVLVLLLVLATVVLSWLARGATHGTSRGLTESLGAKEIEVIQGYGGPDSPPLNTDAVKQLGKLDGVEHVFPSGMSGIDPPADVADSEDGARPWWLMPRNPFDDRMKDAHGDPVASLEPGRCWSQENTRTWWERRSRSTSRGRSAPTTGWARRNDSR